MTWLWKGQISVLSSYIREGLPLRNAQLLQEARGVFQRKTRRLVISLMNPNRFTATLSCQDSPSPSPPPFLPPFSPPPLPPTLPSLRWKRQLFRVHQFFLLYFCNLVLYRYTIGFLHVCPLPKLFCQSCSFQKFCMFFGIFYKSARLYYTVPKEIDFPRYNTKCSGENKILRGRCHWS